MTDLQLMTKLHQHPAVYAWPLAPAQAVTLGPAAHARELWVHEGRVWLTRRVTQGMADDVWLEAGQGLQMAAGDEWVAEAWPAARLSVLPARPAALSRGAPGPRAWWRALARRWPRPASPAGSRSAVCAA